MKYSEFVKKVVLLDSRNSFNKYDGNLDFVPDELKEFYRECNPIDVEISGVRFIPAEELNTTQLEYSYLNAEFIFATSNGDPIFLNDGCVYTIPHGVKVPSWEMLSKNVETYLSSLLRE